MNKILSSDIDDDFVLISTEREAVQQELRRLRQDNDALLKVCKWPLFSGCANLSRQGIENLHGLLAQKEEHIELARYIIRKLRGQAEGK